MELIFKKCITFLLFFFLISLHAFSENTFNISTVSSPSSEITNQANPNTSENIIFFSNMTELEQIVQGASGESAVILISILDTPINLSNWISKKLNSKTRLTTLVERSQGKNDLFVPMGKSEYELVDTIKRIPVTIAGMVRVLKDPSNDYRAFGQVAAHVASIVVGGYPIFRAAQIGGTKLITGIDDLNFGGPSLAFATASETGKNIIISRVNAAAVEGSLVEAIETGNVATGGMVLFNGMGVNPLPVNKFVEIQNKYTPDEIINVKNTLKEAGVNVEHLNDLELFRLAESLLTESPAFIVRQINNHYNRIFKCFFKPNPKEALKLEWAAILEENFSNFLKNSAFLQIRTMPLDVLTFLKNQLIKYGVQTSELSFKRGVKMMSE